MAMEPAPEEVWGGAAAFRADYAETSAVYKALVDIRFRLLAFVPTATAVAVALLGRQTGTSGPLGGTNALTLGVGVLGLLVTVGVVMYEIRNSQLHDQAIHRLKHLEKLLGLRPAVIKPGPGGLFDERGGRLSVLGVSLWHDRALSVIYGTTAGAWTWLVYEAAEDIVDDPPLSSPEWLTWAIPAAVGVAVAWQIVRLSDHGRAGGPLYTLCERDLADDWNTRWIDLHSVLEHTQRPKWRPWKRRADWFVKRLVDCFAQRLARSTGERKSAESRTNVRGPAERRVSAMIEIARGLGFIETTRMTVFLRARLGSLSPSCRAKGAREKRRRRYQLTSRGESLLHALHTGDTDARRKQLLEGLRAGVIGVEDVYRCRATPAIAKRQLRARYGANAPWCADDEIEARFEWLREADELVGFDHLAR
jgi:hypothetical protein